MNPETLMFAGLLHIQMAIAFLQYIFLACCKKRAKCNCDYWPTDVSETENDPPLSMLKP